MNTQKISQKIRWMLFLVLAVVILTVSTFPSAPASAAPSGLSTTCKNLIQDYVNWAKKPGCMVSMQLSGLNVKSLDPNDSSNFAYGRWGSAPLDASSNTSMSGILWEYFSDRWDSTVKQRFYKGSPDKSKITISSTDGIFLILESWGNTQIHTTDLTCYSDGFIVFRIPGTLQMVTMYMLKTYGPFQ